ncbi:MAG TPA: hypothetical protein VFA79_04625, partial [Myxococcales bacterium]|nr:hypothetical protein [Myxococcales bacterium]
MKNPRLVGQETGKKPGTRYTFIFLRRPGCVGRKKKNLYCVPRLFFPPLSLEARRRGWLLLD